MPVKISSDIYVGVKALMYPELTDMPQEKFSPVEQTKFSCAHGFSVWASKNGMNLGFL